MQHTTSLAPFKTGQILSEYETSKILFEIIPHIHSYQHLIEIALLPTVTLDAKKNFLTHINYRLKDIIQNNDELTQVSDAFATEYYVLSQIICGLKTIDEIINLNHSFQFIHQLNRLTVPEVYTIKGLLAYIIADLNGILKLAGGLNIDEIKSIFNFVGRDSFLSLCQNTNAKEIDDAFKELSEEKQLFFMKYYHDASLKYSKFSWVYNLWSMQHSAPKVELPLVTKYMPI